MYNNTLTASERYFLSSYLQNYEVEKERQNIYIETGEKNVFDFGYLYSIVLRRNEIAKELGGCFKFETIDEELDFLSANINILQLLPNITQYIKNIFDSNAELSLELMSEDEDWQTLFINIKTKKDWKETDKFTNEFLDHLYELFPDVAEKLNINIVPNEF